MKKLFLFLVAAFVVVTSFQPAAATRPADECKDICTTQIIGGRVCKVCQRRCVWYEDEGDVVAWGPPITTCIPIP